MVSWITKIKLELMAYGHVHYNKSVWGESTSRVRLEVRYIVQDMHSFLFEYFCTVVLAPHAIRCRVAQAE
jgi:hypothetical protein